MAEMDSELIIQVIVNIVDNAIKYTEPGSEIIIRAKRVGDNIEVEIADNGPGISDDSKEKLFNVLCRV